MTNHKEQALDSAMTEKLKIALPKQLPSDLPAPFYDELADELVKRSAQGRPKTQQQQREFLNMITGLCVKHQVRLEQLSSEHVEQVVMLFFQLVDLRANMLLMSEPSEPGSTTVAMGFGGFGLGGGMTFEGGDFAMGSMNSEEDFQEGHHGGVSLWTEEDQKMIDEVAAVCAPKVEAVFKAFFPDFTQEQHALVLEIFGEALAGDLSLDDAMNALNSILDQLWGKQPSATRALRLIPLWKNWHELMDERNRQLAAKAALQFQELEQQQKDNPENLALVHGLRDLNVLRWSAGDEEFFGAMYYQMAAVYAQLWMNIRGAEMVAANKADSKH